MKLAVEIQKTSLESSNLRDLLASLGFTVFDSENFPAFTSEEMDKCLTPAEAFELAKRVRTAMHGPAGIDAEFRLGAVLELSCNPPKQHVFIEVQSSTIQMKAGSIAISVGPPAGLSESELALWKEQQEERNYQAKLEQQLAKLEPVFWNENAAKVLDLLSKKEQTGETLYKIYELAEGHKGRRPAFQAQFGIATEEFKRFEDAVHNPMVTGDWARHASGGRPKTPQPMSKVEAERFVRQLATAWLDSVRRSR